jgi:hypothetical protein
MWKLEPARLIVLFGRAGVQGIYAAIRAAKEGAWRARMQARARTIERVTMQLISIHSLH